MIVIPVFQMESILFSMLNSCKKATSIVFQSFEESSLISGISDTIVVKWDESNVRYRTSPLIVCFGSVANIARKQGQAITVFMNNSPKRIQHSQLHINKYGYLQPLYPSKQFIDKLSLQSGRNHIKFVLEGIKSLEAEIYLYTAQDRIIISDLDGTMTKTDIKGFYHNYRGTNYIHQGYDQLINRICENGYRVVWITMRSIALYGFSKRYINQHIGKGGVLLPEPEQFFHSFNKELMKNTSNTKTNMIKEIRNLFPPDVNPLMGGLGNRQNDAIAYLAAGIPASQIYLVDKKSQVHRLDTETHPLSYATILSEVDNHFPPVSPPPQLKNDKVGTNQADTLSRWEQEGLHNRKAQKRQAIILGNRKRRYVQKYV